MQYCIKFILYIGDIMIYNNVLEMIGNTPCIKLDSLSNNFKNEIYAKIEKQNPSGSIKDRVAYYIITKLLKEKVINRKTVIIEATSGNTGIGIAMVCAKLKMKSIIVMNENVTKERIKIIKSFGSNVILTKEEGIEGAINKAKELNQRIDNSYYINQFDNDNNLLCHYDTTAEEILKDFGNSLDYIFVGMGSSGTIMGIAKKMKEKSKTKIIGVEPQNCPYYMCKKTGSYIIPGIGTTFMPKITNLKFIDDISLVNDDDAFNQMKNIMISEGISAGVSSGAVASGMINYIKKFKIKNCKILLIFPDSIEKYLSII